MNTSQPAATDKSHKIIITGTGRTGTTFLVQLLTELGLDTGFKDATEGLYENCNAGMEYTLDDPAAPYIVKNPWLCDDLERLLKTGKYVIDHALIPVRKLEDAAGSRIAVTAQAHAQAGLPAKIKGFFKPRGVPGGMWHTSDPKRQPDVLAGQLYKLIYAVTVYDIPHTFLAFPRLVRDPDYLYGKLAGVFHSIEWETFQTAFHRVARPELVHSFPRRT